jgi:hypothetical protein
MLIDVMDVCDGYGGCDHVIDDGPSGSSSSCNLTHGKRETARPG